MAVSEGRKSFSEDGTLEDGEGQHTSRHTIDQTKQSNLNCITESFPDVEHKETVFFPSSIGFNYELQAPDADMNWFRVQNEKECCELMRRNDNASAYAIEQPNSPRWTAGGGGLRCTLYSKGIYKWKWTEWSDVRCVGYRKTDMCASVEGVEKMAVIRQGGGGSLDDRPWYLSTPRVSFSSIHDSSRVKFEKDCAQKMFKTIENYIHSFENKAKPRGAYYFLPKAKSGDDNCIVGSKDETWADFPSPDYKNLEEGADLGSWAKWCLGFAEDYEQSQGGR